MKPFSTIPGAIKLPLIGTLHQYFPIVGSYTGVKLHNENMDKYNKYGPIVREDLTSADPPLLHLFHPDDFETIFRNENENPSRHSHLALKHYRLNKREMYCSGGLLPTNGKEWWRLRKAFQKNLSSPKSVTQFIPVVDEAVAEWLTNLEGTINNQEDFLHQFWIIFLQIAGNVLLNHRFFTYKLNEDNLNPLSLVKAALTTNENVVYTDVGFKEWRIINTKSYENIKISQEYMEKITIDLIKKYSEDKTNNENCLVSKWLQIENITEKDVLTMTIDFFLAGIDTTANTSSFLLYYVSANSRVQEKLYEECLKLLPNNNSCITENVLNEAKYAKAILKETLRLRPVSIGIGRLLTKDITINNYHIPKGINVLTNNQVACRMEKHFQKPMEFIPERWIKDCSLYKKPHPFLLLPFGFGPRACIARRLAEQNILIMLIKIIRKFHVKWVGEELDSENHLIQKPDKLLKFKFFKR